MNANPPTPHPFSRLARLCALWTGVALLIGTSAGVAWWLLARSDVEALQDGVLTGDASRFSKRIKVGLGVVPVQLLKAGLHFAPLPPEARTAISSVRGFEVGVYEAPFRAKKLNHALLFARAEKSLAGRGWAPMVTVSHDDQAVEIFAEESGRLGGILRLCALIYDGQRLILVSAEGRPQPLMDLVRGHLKGSEMAVAFSGL